MVRASRGRCVSRNGILMVDRLMKVAIGVGTATAVAAGELNRNLPFDRPDPRTSCLVVSR